MSHIHQTVIMNNDSIEVIFFVLLIINIWVLRCRPNCPVAILILLSPRTRWHNIRLASPDTYLAIAGMPRGRIHSQVVGCRSSHIARRNWMRIECRPLSMTGRRDSRLMPMRTRPIWSAPHIAGWGRSRHGIPAER